MDEIIPVEMVSYIVHDGRVFFTAPKLFEASLFLGGSQRDDGWFFANVRFLFTIGGDLTGIQGMRPVSCSPFGFQLEYRFPSPADGDAEPTYHRRSQCPTTLLHP